MLRSSVFCAVVLWALASTHGAFARDQPAEAPIPAIVAAQEAAWNVDGHVRRRVPIECLE